MPSGTRFCPCAVPARTPTNAPDTVIHRQGISMAARRSREASKTALSRLNSLFRRQAQCGSTLPKYAAQFPDPGAGPSSGSQCEAVKLLPAPRLRGVNATVFWGTSWVAGRGCQTWRVDRLAKTGIFESRIIFPHF